MAKKDNMQNLTEVVDAVKEAAVKVKEAVKSAVNSEMKLRQRFLKVLWLKNGVIIKHIKN